MRILHAIHSADPKGGGPIEALKQLSLENIAQGHSVDVVTVDAPGQDWMMNFPLRLYPMGPSTTGYGFSPRFVPWLRRNHRNYDVVIVNGIWQYGSLGVWRALHHSGTPYCVFTHGMLDPWFKKKYPLKHLKKWLYWPWAEYRVLRDARAVFFTCEEERRLARKSFWLYHCNEIVLTLGTAAAVGEPANQRAQFIERFPGLAGRRCILFLGRIHEKKGCDLLVEAFARLIGEATQQDDLHLVMAGPAEGEYAESLKQTVAGLGIESRVTWTGMLVDGVKWGALRAADVFILPSHQENFGIAVAEALACRLPVLISNKVNIWREIDADGAGLVEPDDTEGTYRLLKRWIDFDSTRREAMRSQSIKCYQKRFSIPEAGKAFIDALALLGA